ncbi:hypothetical protein PFLmoz3_00859 [Pseudomonas fluorescens]|uniref:Uncharacterized protein n=1 Tax=Pseudomonas fluorescens TaxID=294 RepID=A0A109LK85_PSEFL|nr:hypothetical protein PFLmoz3_00859 [Pseudomonas fluorescens]
MSLGGVDHLLQHQTLRAPPVTGVDQAGILGHQLVFKVGDFTVQGDGLDGAVGTQHDGAARGFVATARLHAHITVLDDVETADTMLTADAVQGRQYRGRGHFNAVQRNDVAVAVSQFQVLRLVWSVLRGDRPFPHIFFVLGPGVFQHAAFIGNVQQVGVHRVRRLLLAMALDRNSVLFSVIHQLFTGQQVPFTPRRNDFNAWLECVGTQFETYLVVTLAGGAVRNGVGARFVGDLDQALGDQRTCDGGTQQVLTFVDSVGAKHRENEIADELFAQVVNVDLFHAHGLRLGTCRFDLFTLTQVSGEGHHFTVISILQPLEDHRSVQAAGIRENDLVYVGHAITPRGCTERRRFYRSKP